MKNFKEWLELRENTAPSIIGQQVDVNSMKQPGDPMYSPTSSRRAIILRVLPQTETEDLGFLVKYLDNGETEEVSSGLIPSVFKPPLRNMIPWAND